MLRRSAYVLSAPIRVLLVEDNPADADLAADQLEHGRLHVDLTVINDGARALAFLRKEGDHADAPRPDLVLLDLNMPGVDGREVLRVCKSDSELRSIPIVVLTSSDAERDVLESYDLGANCFVNKPLSLHAFATIVRSIESFWFSVVRLPTS